MPTSQFLKPDLDNSTDALPLFITGALPSARPGEAYEGRLQINNQIGSCQVISATGFDIESIGGRIYCEGDELVVAWPAYSATPIELANPNFATGDTSGWTITPYGEVPGSSGLATADPARPYSGTDSAKCQGNEGLGHAGAVEALWVNNVRGPAYPGQVLNISAMIALDDTDTSQNRGQVRAVFYDRDGLVIGDPREVTPDYTYPYKGTLILGDNEAYRPSELQALPPNGSVEASAAVWTTANESPGSAVRFGDVQWDAPVTVGVNVETTYCWDPITIRDSAGRTAPWSGCVSITGARVAFAAVFNSDTAGSTFWKVYDDLTTATGTLPFSRKCTLFKVCNGRLYAGNITDGVWFSEDEGGTWTQCTGVLAKIPSDIHKSYYGYILVYNQIANAEISVSLDGLAFSTVTAAAKIGGDITVLVAGQQLTHAEAAEILGVAEATISWRMHEVRRMLAAGGEG